MINKELERLMLRAGYVAPHLAKRAQKLAELVIQECCVIVEDAIDYREPASTYVSKIQQRFRVENGSDK